MYHLQAETFKGQFNTSLFSPCHFDQQYPDGGPSTKQHDKTPADPHRTQSLYFKLLIFGGHLFPP